VRLPAETESTTAEGLVERKELLPGVYIAGSLVKVVHGCVITSVLNTTEKEVKIPEPVFMVTNIDSDEPCRPDSKDPAEQDKSRYERVLSKQNTNADALSRIDSVTAETKGSTKLDDETKKQILYEFHEAPVGGHRGMNKTFRAFKSRYSWPNMWQEIEEYVKQCKSCQVNKTLKPKR
jgi:hypothetical protein